MVNASGSGVVRHRTDRVRTGDGPIAESEWTESGQRDDLDESERRREESAFKRSDADQLARRDRGLVPFPLTQFEFDSLFERILEVTGEEDDWKIRSLYRRYAETLGPPLVERALSATKDRKLDASQPKVRRLGAYFNKTCRSIAVECNIELGRDGGTRAAPADPRASASEEGCGKPVAETLSAQDTGCASAPT